MPEIFSLSKRNPIQLEGIILRADSSERDDGGEARSLALATADPSPYRPPLPPPFPLSPSSSPVAPPLLTSCPPRLHLPLLLRRWSN